MSRVNTISICGAIAFMASLTLAHVHPFGDAGLYAATSAKTPMLNQSQVPAEVHAILVDKCANCHSNQPNAPVYGHFAPVSWMMERDIVEARKAMNLSQWEAYTPDQQQTLAAKIVQEAKSHQMPPEQYRLIHWNARVTDAEIQTLASWARASSASSGSESNQQAGEGDPVRGKKLLEKRCTGCHSLTQNHQGPRLQGVYGRVSGTVADYAYSQTLKKSQIIWDEKSLEQWLTDPDAYIPGNDMDFLVSKPQDRRDLIRYLKQISDK